MRNYDLRKEGLEEVCNLILREIAKENPNDSPEELLKKVNEEILNSKFRISTRKPIWVAPDKEDKEKYPKFLEALLNYKDIKHFPDAELENLCKCIEYEDVNFAFVCPQNYRTNFKPFLERILNFGSLPVKNPFNHRSDRNKFIKATRELFRNTDAYSTGMTLTNFRRFIENIYANLNEPGAKLQNICLYQYSVKGGCGKTIFVHKLEAFLKSKKIPSTPVRPKGRWTGSEFSSNLYGYDEEWMPPSDRYGRDETIEKLNKIIDNVEYVVEYKYGDELYSKSKITMILNSNYMPYDRNDRRYGIVNYYPVQVEFLPKDVQEKWFSLSDEEWNNLFEQAFESCPFGEVFKDKVKPAGRDLSSVIFDCREVIKEGSSVDWTSLTSREFVELYMKITNDFGRIDKTEMKSKLFSLRDVLRKAVSEGTIKPVKMINGDTDYSKFNFEEIKNMATNEDEVAVDFSNEENQWVATYKSFSNFLTPEDDNPPKKFLSDEPVEGDFPSDLESKKEITDKEPFFKADKESKLDDSWTVLDRFDEEGKYNKNGDQACVNKPLEGECKNRCDNRVHKQNYLFECDNISLEEQCKKIWDLPESFRKCILWACKTGGKSIHVVTATNTPDYADSKMRQYIHGRINDMIFDGKADPSTFNAGRIARAPNATRHDKKHPGAHQTCYLFNMNAEKLDVSKFVKEFEEIEEEKKFFYRFKGMVNQEYERKGEGVHTLEELRKWNESHPSDAKRECIDFLEGNLKYWNRGIACVRKLRLFGFSDDEIVSEGPANDTWIAGAIKSAK